MWHARVLVHAMWPRGHTMQSSGIPWTPSILQLQCGRVSPDPGLPASFRFRYVRTRLISPTSPVPFHAGRVPCFSSGASPSPFAGGPGCTGSGPPGLGGPGSAALQSQAPACSTQPRDAWLYVKEWHSDSREQTWGEDTVAFS